MKTILIPVFSIAFLLFSSCTAQISNIDADAFAAAIKRGDSIQILDVRTAQEFNTGHIKNALLADWNNMQEFDRRIGFIDKKKLVYVYCLAGGRSAAAAKKLKENGYENVYNLTGGINAWKAAEQPVEGESNSEQMTMTAFDIAIHSAETVLVDFGADWCPPCRKMEPIIKNLQNNHGSKFKLIKVDGGKDETVLQTYNVTALPVFIIFKNGKQVWRKDGVAEEKEILDNL